MAADPLAGPRLRLRAPADADLPKLHAWYNDPEIVAPFDRFSTESFDEFVRAVAAAPGDPASVSPRFVVERTDRAAPEPIGFVGHYRAHPVLELTEVWYVLAATDARGQGLGVEAVGLLVGHLFGTTEVERVGASCDVDNVPSYRLLERLGFRREGTLKSALYHHARWHDVLVYGVTRAEWTARPARG